MATGEEELFFSKYIITTRSTQSTDWTWAIQIGLNQKVKIKRFYEVRRVGYGGGAWSKLGIGHEYDQNI